MKKVLVQGVLGLQEMIELDSGLVVPIETAKKKFSQELFDAVMKSLTANENSKVEAPPLVN